MSTHAHRARRAVVVDGGLRTWPGATFERASARAWMVPLAAVAGSRALVLLSAVIASLQRRDSGWQAFDPGGISAHLGTLGNVLASPVVRWDAIWYLGIAQHGYSSTASTAFFPVYPLAIRLLAPVSGSAVVAGALVSTISFAVALLVLHRLTELELGRRAADLTVILLAFAPLSFFFSAVYTESLFLALALGCTYAARKEHWALAGLLGALAAATRVTGVLLVALVLLPAAGRRGSRLEKQRAWLLAVPLGLAAFLVRLQATGRGWLSPFKAQASVAHAHKFSGPVVAILHATQAATSGLLSLVRGSQPVLEPHALGAPFSNAAESLYLFGVLVLAAILVVAGLRMLPRAYGILALLALLVSISSPVAGDPLKSLDRYSLTIFPLWMAAGALLAGRRLRMPVIALSAGLLVFFTVQFTAWTFVA